MPAKLHFFHKEVGLCGIDKEPVLVEAVENSADILLMLKDGLLRGVAG